jgi:carboxymethylenebutenolidase
MKGNDVTFCAGDGARFRVYVAGDTSPRRPAIIMFPPIFGVDADAMAIADRWADRGYLIAAPDYFFRTAPGVLDRSEGGRKRAMERWKALDVNRCIDDMQSLKSQLLAMQNCNGGLAALGFCAGGELAFLAATRLGAKAVATFHATHIDRHLDEAAQIEGAITMHFGGNDLLVPLDKVELIRSKLSADGRVDIHVYPGVGHGFSFRGQPAYDETAATSSDRRAQEVLASMNR